MSLNTAVMFGKASDEWETPQVFFDELDREFHFGLDAAARLENRKCLSYLSDALYVDWTGAARGASIWLNPPYSRCAAFIAKAAQEARCGSTVVCLVPSRTDTRWWHRSVWDDHAHRPRLGVEVRFIKGRLKFGGTGKADNSAPFPSVVIVFRPSDLATLPTDLFSEAQRNGGG